MHLSDFQYSLPEELIAQVPLKKREKAKMMVIDRRSQTITHSVFEKISDYLPAESVIILNDSKVIPARLFGRKHSGQAVIEIFVLKKLATPQTYQTLMRPLKRLKEKDRIVFDGTKLEAQLIDREQMIVRFNTDNLEKYMKKLGHIPLPPYIRRDDNYSDKRFYQTVYAKHPGSVASPTAGLHFTKPLMQKLKKKRHEFVSVTLHVNYGTFKPVEEPDITRHKIHKEDYSVTDEACATIQQARQAGKKIVAIGTTSTRVLETLAEKKALQGETGLFVYPGYQFLSTDCLLTNFHLPASTLLMLVYAFGGMDLMKRAYAEAIENKYRFYSYGDCMLIL